MQKQSVVLFILLLLISFIIGWGLYFTVSKTKSIDSNLVFYAVVKEVNDNSAIILPFADAKISSSELLANIPEVKIGDVLKITCLSEIRETFPAQITVVDYQKVAFLGTNNEQMSETIYDE